MKVIYRRSYIVKGGLNEAVLNGQFVEGREEVQSLVMVLRSMTHARDQTMAPMPPVKLAITAKRTQRQQNLPHPTPDMQPAIRATDGPKKNQRMKRVHYWLLVSLPLRRSRVFSCSSLQDWPHPEKPHLSPSGIVYLNLL